jgi:flagellar hook-length control protein FliK
VQVGTVADPTAGEGAVETPTPAAAPTTAAASSAAPAEPAVISAAAPGPPAQALPAVVPVSVSPVSVPTASASAPPAPAPLTGQLATPLFSLAAAGPGEHTLSISVTPDDLGPVLVRAQISAAGVRLEMFAPTESARDALRQILPELRRDLAGGGLAASLDISARSQPADAGPSGRQDRSAPDSSRQGGGEFGGHPRGNHDGPRQAAADPWLTFSPSGSGLTDPAGDTAGAARYGPANGRVDVLA